MALKEASQDCVVNKIAPQLEATVEQDLPIEMQWSIDPDTDDVDQQTLLFTYPTAFPDHPDYLRQVVKIEMGARSDTEPSQKVKIEPIISTTFPDQFPDSRFPVMVVMPIRTFWEKAMLLHEETFRQTDKKRKQGMARHYYDLYRLISMGIAEEAASNIDLFHRIAEHRATYFRYTWVDYSTLKQGSLRLIPPEEQFIGWRRDYDAMQNEMFYGDVPEFSEVMETVKQFQDKFNRDQQKAQNG